MDILISYSSEVYFGPMSGPPGRARQSQPPAVQVCGSCGGGTLAVMSEGILAFYSGTR